VVGHDDRRGAALGAGARVIAAQDALDDQRQASPRTQPLQLGDAEVGVDAACEGRLAVNGRVSVAGDRIAPARAILDRRAGSSAAAAARGDVESDDYGAVVGRLGTAQQLLGPVRSRVT
jgi:hypothetical protein